MKGFLEYVPGDTLFHRLHPITKLILALLLCVAAFLSQNHFVVIALILWNLCLAASAGILDRALFMLKTLIKFGIFLFIIQLLCVHSGHVLVNLPFGLVITDRGLAFSCLIVLRLLAATLPLALMLSLTKISDLTAAFVDGFGMPYSYAFALTTALRFIPVFTNEMQDIMAAQTARGAAFDTKNPFKKMALVLPLCVPLLISSVKRSDNAAISAELRGFSLRRPGQSFRQLAFHRRDILVFLVIAALFALVICL